MWDVRYGMWDTRCKMPLSQCQAPAARHALTSALRVLTSNTETALQTLFLCTSCINCHASLCSDTVEWAHWALPVHCAGSYSMLCRSLEIALYKPYHMPQGDHHTQSVAVLNMIGPLLVWTSVDVDLLCFIMGCSRGYRSVEIWSWIIPSHPSTEFLFVFSEYVIFVFL